MARHGLLIYSHDSYGLGHLRRCRSIALSLVDRFPELEVMILSGLPIVSEFEFHPRIAITLVPPVIKLSNGDYRAAEAGKGLTRALAERSRIILQTATAFRPDLFLVDKEPLGIRGEVRATLVDLHRRGIPTVLGLRDVMDEPQKFAAEWARKGSGAAVDELFDEIWVYGLKSIYEPLQGLPVSASVAGKTLYTSYLRRETSPLTPEAEALAKKPFLLVTPGGGGDGDRLVNWVLSALEYDRDCSMRVLVVTGPFMDSTLSKSFAARAAKLPHVELITFLPGIEGLMSMADGVVAMGGYNTFCEILSFDLPALIVPRTTPRLEQAIRAERAARLGLVDMLADDGECSPAQMAEALRRLPHRARPSAVVVPGLLDGHAVIAARVAHWIGESEQPAARRPSFAHASV